MSISRISKLLSIRDRIIDDFNHHIDLIQAFNAQTNQTAIRFRIMVFEKTFTEFNNVINELEKLSAFHEADDKADMEKKHRLIQDKYLETKLQMSELMQDGDITLNSTFYQPNNFGENEQSYDTNQSNNQTSRLGIKLPHITIVPFSGKYEDWPEFRDTFTSLIKKYRGDDVEKLTHLKNFLQGEARDAIKHLGVRNGNYTVAWETLTKTYENRHAIIEAHLKSFSDISPIKHTAPSSIRDAITTTNNCLAGIQNLDIMIDSWDPMIVFLLKGKLDMEIHSKWEEERKGSNEPPTWSEFKKFLETRYKIYIKIVSSTPAKYPIKTTITSRPAAIKAFATNDQITENQTNKSTESNDIQIEQIESDENNSESEQIVLVNKNQEICGICNETHRVFNCPKLTNPDDALQFIIQRGLCQNCLYRHDTSKCLSKHACQKCNQRHHTKLHDAFVSGTSTNIQLINHVSESQQTVLATALIPVYTPGKQSTILRALIDQGSMTNLMTERGMQLLGCKTTAVNIPLFGIGNIHAGTVQRKAALIIGSLYSTEYQLSIEVLITQHIKSLRQIAAGKNWTHLQNIQLADPHLDNQKDIDLLIGAPTFAEILDSGLIKGQSNEPIAQKTKLGWIISGRINTPSPEIRTHLVTNELLSDQMKQFWEIEEVTNKKIWSNMELECESYFLKNISREKDGKLLVRIPFNHDQNSPTFLGNSFENAKRRFLYLERRFKKDEKLKNEYAKCINEYITLNHAVKASKICHVIPHHAVLKESSLTTKLRVVFDASAKTTNGISLNERMHVGPVLLEEIWAVLLRWRVGKIAMIADIEKMYRQFWVHQEDAKFQQILWRNKPEDNIEIYELKTVTFGTAAAPYLAIRCLHYIADQIENENPDLSHIIKKCFYVDDALPSFDTIESAKKCKEALTDIFDAYGLPLRKWNSNAKEIITMENNDQMIELKINPENKCSTLGMYWNTESDMLSYKVTDRENSIFTKRKILSEIASLYDPLGLLAPIVIRAKIFMQQLWLGTFKWDDNLPPHLIQEWSQLKLDLLKCKDIQRPRWIGYVKQHTHVSIHGFSDASERAYAAVIYLRTIDITNGIQIQLITSKTKVSPLKKISIPRLELCAAVLTTNLLDKVMQTLEFSNYEVYAWTDSSPALAWISTQPYKLHTFEANRVAKIQEKIAADKWRYVPTKQNPADHASRGLNTDKFINCSQWWIGPEFLQLEPKKWPQTPPEMISKEISKMKTRVHMQKTEISPENELLLKFDSLNRLLRTTAYCLRFLKRNKEYRKCKILQPIETIESRNQWIRIIQAQNYAKEIQMFNQKQEIPNNSLLLSLNPFIKKEDGILRVGGRLRHAILTEERKNPAILPTQSHFSKLVIRQAHDKTYHGGVQTTLRCVRDEYWIIRGLPAVKNQLSKCVICTRYPGPHLQRQQMADLLPAQVQQNRPFSHTGVDFAGYFEVKQSTKRNAAYQKCYVSLFICLTTKAIHLELAHNLSTDAFLATFNRFTARRGFPNHMYSDRGTNFIGAASIMPQLWTKVNTTESQAIQQHLSKLNVSWHFNPARASHFGGLWEAGVKSMKTHIYRVLKNTKLTFEEFNTTITQIEACLNSRPLCAFIEDPDNLDALTPAHFLIGQAILTPPHPDVTHLETNRLSRYQFLQRLLQLFWKKWSHEYLSRLQQRPKWKQQHPNMEVGQIVLIHDETMPTQWNMGRITKTFKGADQLVRSVEVNCKGVTITRPIHKLSLLPIDDNTKNNELMVLYHSLIPRENVDLRSKLNIKRLKTKILKLNNTK